MNEHSVAVVGGGIAGLAAAWELAQNPGTRVVVLEADSEVGGKIRSAPFAGRMVDLGADGFVARRPEAIELCRELGLEAALDPPGTRGAGVWVGDRLRPLPDGLALGIPTRLAPLARSAVLSPVGLGRCALDFLGICAGSRPERDGDVSVGDLVRRRMGRQVVERLADPLIGGINAGSVDTMSAALSYPPLLEAAVGGRSLMRGLRRITPPPSSADSPVFLRVRGGQAVLVESLRQALDQRGVQIRCASPVVELGRGRHFMVQTPAERFEVHGVVLAVPAPVSAVLLGGLGAELSALAGGVRQSSVTLATMAFDATDVGATLAGTGFLIPRQSGLLLTACTYLSAKWPELARQDDVLIRVSAGRDGDARPGTMDDDELIARAVSELAIPLQLRGSPRQAMVARFEGAFPQYDVGHAQRIDRLQKAVADVGAIELAGAMLRGVGIPACIGSGRSAARAVLSRMGS